MHHICLNNIPVQIVLPVSIYPELQLQLPPDRVRWPPEGHDRQDVLEVPEQVPHVY